MHHRIDTNSSSFRLRRTEVWNVEEVFFDDLYRGLENNETFDESSFQAWVEDLQERQRRHLAEHGREMFPPLIPLALAGANAARIASLARGAMAMRSAIMARTSVSATVASIALKAAGVPTDWTDLAAMAVNKAAKKAWEKGQEMYNEMQEAATMREAMQQMQGIPMMQMEYGDMLGGGGNVGYVKVRDVCRRELNDVADAKESRRRLC